MRTPDEMILLCTIAFPKNFHSWNISSTAINTTKVLSWGGEGERDKTFYDSKSSLPSLAVPHCHRRHRRHRCRGRFTLFVLPTHETLFQAWASAKYDLVLLTGLIISTAREVADVETFSRPILATRRRLSCFAQLVLRSYFLSWQRWIYHGSMTDLSRCAVLRRSQWTEFTDLADRK